MDQSSSPPRGSRLAVALATTMLVAACSGAATPAPTAAPTTVAAASAGASAAASPTPKGPPLKISVAFGLTLGNSSNPFAWIGRELGFFAEENIDPDIISLNGDSARGDAMLASNQLDVGIFGLEKVLTSAAQGTILPEHAVFNVQNKLQYEGVVLTNSPIKTIQDLKGKKIGEPQLGTTLETYITQTLATVNLKPTDVTFVAVGTGVPMGEAVKNGSVDAAFATRGQLGAILQGGYDLRFLPRPAFADSYITGNVVARSDLSPEKTQALKGYLKAYAESLVFSKANPQAAMLVNWHMFPDAVPKNVSLDSALKSALDTYTAYLSYINPLNGKWGYMPPDLMLAYENYLSIDPSKVDVTKFYTNDFIDYANSFDTAKIEAMAKSYVAPTPGP